MIIKLKSNGHIFFIVFLLFIVACLTGCRDERPQEHVHTIEKVEEVAPTCSTTGTSEHYKCSECGHLFLDPDGNFELSESEIKLEIIDHDDLNTDGKCDYCLEELDYYYLEETNTYYIYNAKGLQEWAKTSYLNNNVELMADITLEEELIFKDDGGCEANLRIVKYKGVFNGNNHTISGLIMNFYEESYGGLFKHVDEGSVIKNLHLKDVVITGGGQTGGICGYIDGGSIINCSVSGSIKTSGVDLGGIAGMAYQSKIIACINYADLENTYGGTGGIVGQGFSEETIIIGCINVGSIKGVYAGGLTYRYFASSIAGSYSTGYIADSVDGSYGIGTTGEIEACYWSTANTNIDEANMYDKGIGRVDGVNLTWEEAMVEMNKVLASYNVNYRYELNTGSNSDILPLILKEVE